MSENPHVYGVRRQRSGRGKAGRKIKLSEISLAAAGLLSREVLLFAVLGFLLSRAQVLGNLLPFGPAFYAALVCCDRKQVLIQVLPIMAGLLTVVSGQQLLANAGVFLILALVFLFYSIDSGKQWVLVPALVLTATVVAKGLVLLFGQSSDYLVMVTVFESLFAGGLSLVFLVAIGVVKNASSLNSLSPDEIVCLFVCILGLIMGLGSWSIGGVELRSMVSRFLVMAAAFVGGSGAGAGIGALVGVIPSLSEMVAPSVIGIYAFSGLLAGAFSGFGRIGVVMGFFLGNLLLALYLLNTPMILASLTASACAGCALFLIPEPVLAKMGRIFRVNGESKLRKNREDIAGRLALQRLDHMGKVFDDLACTLDQISGEVQEAEEQNINTILNHIAGRICQECTMQKICWEKDFYQTYRSVMGLFTTIENNGAASLKDMPPLLRKRCSHIKEMLATVNCLYELYKKNSFWQRQMVSTRALIANQLTGSAQIMNRLVDEIKNYGPSREVLEYDLGRQLIKKNFPLKRVTINGMGPKTVDLTLELDFCPGVDECRQILAPVMSRLTGLTYEVYQSNCSIETSIKSCWFRLFASGARRISVGKAQVAMEEGQISGDCSGTIILPDAKQVLMLSDGMGVGSRAATESGTTLALLEQLLETGFNQQVAINTINSVLMLRSREETFATVDLCITDLYQGTTDFVKIGSAPSFLKKADGVRIIRSSSLPVGILHSVDVETIPEQVDIGDIIVMATDGLLGSAGTMEEMEQWIVRALEETRETNPQRIAEMLLKKALQLAGGRLRDDITVLVALVEGPKDY